MNNLNNNQRDLRWANTLLGFSELTIGADGCVISCIGDALGTTPDVVNKLLKQFGGFTDALVVWEKLSEAFPGINAVVHSSYDNNAVLVSLAAGNRVLVFVSAAPIGGNGIHCVEYIGNQQLKDPWIGSIRPTSDFPDLTGEWVEIQGTWSQGTEEANTVIETAVPANDVAVPPPAPIASPIEKLATQGLNTYGIDPTNLDSVQVAFSTWHNVSQGLYEPISSYNALKTSYETLQQEKDQLQTDYNALNTEFTKTKGLMVTLTQEDYDYSQKALDAGKLADAYEKDLTEIYSKLNLDETIDDPTTLLQLALQKIDSLEKSQTVTPGEAEKQLSLWEGFFLKIAQSALNNGLNDYLKLVGKQIVDLDNKPNDANIGDYIVEFLEQKFKDASLVSQAQQQMQQMKNTIAKTQPFLVQLGYAVKNFIFITRTPRG